MPKVIVIGAGTAGLASAIRLRAKGYDVDILEKNGKVGGRMYQIRDQGFSFDVGPTIVMMPDEYKDVFRASGANPDDYIQMERLEPMNTIHFDNENSFRVSSELTSLVRELESISEKDALGYLRYLADVYERYLIAKEHFIEKPFRKASDFFNPKSLWHALRLRTLDSAFTSISRFVKDDNLRKALTFQTLYVGISPFSGPSIYTIIPMIELLYGVWYIKGGMYAMAQALEKRFLEMGGTIRTSHEVTEIVTEGGRVTGVIAGDTFMQADIVLSNVDFPWAMDNLFKNPKDRGKYTHKRITKKMTYSSSAFILYLGLDKKVPTTVHALRFATDFRKNIDDLFDFNVPDDPSFYMYSPSQIDPSVAPGGKDGFYVLVPVPSLQKGEATWDDKETKAYRNKILGMISKIQGFEDIEEHIIVEHIWTPKTFESMFNLQFGATFGLQPTLRQSLYFRPQARSKHVKGLYFAGSSNHPGAGVPIVMISARIAVSEIAKDFPS
jgi:phytoene desaturase